MRGLEHFSSSLLVWFHEKTLAMPASAPGQNWRRPVHLFEHRNAGRPSLPAVNPVAGWHEFLLLANR
jgi:hypothetical protein